MTIILQTGFKAAAPTKYMPQFILVLPSLTSALTCTTSRQIEFTGSLAQYLWFLSRFSYITSRPRPLFILYEWSYFLVMA